jgi:hypothetical protein
MEGCVVEEEEEEEDSSEEHVYIDTRKPTPILWF